MAAPRYPYWVEEQSSTYRGPSMSRLLFGLVLVVLVVIAAFGGGSTATTEGGDRWTRPTTPPPCARHFPPTCPEPAAGR